MTFSDFGEMMAMTFGHLQAQAPPSLALARKSFQIMPCSKVDSWHLPHHLFSPTDSRLYCGCLPLLLSLFGPLPSLSLQPQHPTKPRYNHRFSRVPFLGPSLLLCLHLPSSPGKKRGTFWQVPKGTRAGRCWNQSMKWRGLSSPQKVGCPPTLS